MTNIKSQQVTKTTIGVRKKSRKWTSKNINLMIMCFPAIALMFVFKYLPLIGLTIAFKDFRYDVGFLKSPWVGFKNFEFLVKSNDLTRILKNTLGLNLLFIFVGLIFSVIFAILLNEVHQKFLVKTYQTVLFFPYFISWVVVGYLGYAFLSGEQGVLNSILKSIGAKPIDWYNTAAYWPSILLFFSLWKGVGYGCVMYYAAILGIDTEYYDAAAIDGANKIQSIVHITLPFIKPMMIILTILAIGGIMRSDFGLFYQVTRDSGALYKYTDVIDTYIYRSLKVTGDIGISSAINSIQSIAGFLLVLATNYVAKKFDEESALF